MFFLYSSAQLKTNSAYPFLLLVVFVFVFLFLSFSSFSFLGPIGASFKGKELCRELWMERKSYGVKSDGAND